MKAELEKLIDLQITDTNIRRLKIAIDTADERRAAIEQEFETHASSIREIQGRRDKARAEHTDLENKIADNKVHLERANRNLKHAQNQKEYETSMREADSFQKMITTFETQTVEKMTEIEEVEKVLEERAEEINSLESKREAALKEFDKEISAYRKDFEKESAKRQEVFVTLPANLAAVYNRLTQRSRDGIAVAEVKNGACSACFMALRPQMQAEVRKGNAILTCENCTRILYVPAKPQTEATTN
ncbi:MAG: C4-type zinc ribbon domain-containing protein [Pyrinomonadaceae bacterium]